MFCVCLFPCLFKLSQYSKCCWSKLHQIQPCTSLGPQQRNCYVDQINGTRDMRTTDIQIEMMISQPSVLMFRYKCTQIHTDSQQQTASQLTKAMEQIADWLFHKHLSLMCPKVFPHFSYLKFKKSPHLRSLVKKKKDLSSTLSI